MNSPHVGALLSAYLDGETTSTEQELVERHLAACSDCARILAEYRGFGTGIRTLSRPTPPSTLHRDVWTAIEAQHGRPAWGQALTGVLRFGALAAVLVLAAAVILNGIIHPQRPVAAAEMIYPHPDQTDAGKNSIVVIDFTKPIAQGQDLSALVLVDNTTAKIRQPYLDRQLAPDGRELQLQPVDDKGITQWWLPHTLYTVSVLTDTLFADGSRLDHALSWQFTTGESLNTITPTATDTPVPTATPTATHTPVPTAPAVQNTAIPPTAVISVPTTPPVLSPTQPPLVITTTPPARPSAVPTTVPPRLTATLPPPSATPPSATPPLPPATVTHIVATVTAGLPLNTPTGLPVTATPVAASATASVPPTATIAPPTLTATPTETPTPHPTVGPMGTPIPIHTAGASPTATSGPPTATLWPPTLPPTATSGPPTLPPATATLTPLSTQTPATLSTCRYAVQGNIGTVYTAYYALRNALGCPTAAETRIVQAAGQPFEHGALFWNGDAHLIYLLDSSTTAWFRYTDTWNDGDPAGGSETPPAGFYEPVRGFGKIWREQPNVRTRLGWATAPESGLSNAGIQPFERGTIIRPDNHILRVLYSNGAWEQYDAPQP